ncbi:MAG: response regulator transcription factor [Campylobacteraceae bacterium]|jgi:DNA-binding response OmpR family regulator|nr:response regulator transcription factor [Campylobacteraceae bacterium]
MTQSILKKLTVLYVEDEENIRKTLTKAIEDEFKLFFTAGDGNEGLKKFKKYKPDIVITDLLMPIKDGLSLARDIKAMSKDTLIIVLSAFSEKEKLLGAIDAGVDKYVIKPVYPDEFLLLITNLAQQRFTSNNIINLGGGYEFDKNGRVLIKNGQTITLTKKEIAFIAFLADNLDSFALHEDIKRCVWSKNTSDAAIRTFVKRIREKTDKDFIKNIPALGYKIFTNYENHEKP